MTVAVFEWLTAGNNLRFILEGRLNLKPLITHTLPLSSYAKAVDLLTKKRAIKILFDPWLTE